MGLSDVLGPFSFFFICYIHVTVFCIVCVYYIDIWLLDDFYHNVICGWTGNAGIAITVLYALSFILTILMAVVTSIHPKIFPSLNMLVTCSLIVMTLVVGIRTRNGFLTDFQIYQKATTKASVQKKLNDLKGSLCLPELTTDQCELQIIFYLHKRSSQIGCYTLALLLIFSGIQLALVIKCLKDGPLFQKKIESEMSSSLDVKDKP